MPQVARDLGRFIREFRKESGDDAVDAVDAPLLPEEVAPSPPDDQPTPAGEVAPAEPAPPPTLDDLLVQIEGATAVERLAISLKTVFEVYGTNANRLADATGINRSTIGRWLQGEMRQPPQRDNLETVLDAIPDLSRRHRLEILALAGYVTVAEVPPPPNPIQIYLSCHGDDLAEERTQVSRFLPRREFGFQLQTAAADLTPAEIEAALRHSDFLVLVQGPGWSRLRFTEHQTAVEMDSLLPLYFQRADGPTAAEARRFYAEVVGLDHWRGFAEVNALNWLVFAAVSEKLIAGFRLGKMELSLHSLTALVLVNEMFNRRIFDLPALLRQLVPEPATPMEVPAAPESAPAEPATPPEAEPETKAEPEVRRSSKVEPELVKVPAGNFWMGSDKHDLEQRLLSTYGDETPQHRLRLPTYYIGRYPVTNGEFAHFVRAGGYRTRQFWTEAGWQQREQNNWSEPRWWRDDKWNQPNLPVVGVSWYECVAYCRWLQKVTGRPYRLPTEAEWEKAARGSDGRLWPWGNTWQPSYCNTRHNGPAQTTPVGRYSPWGDSPYGAADMAGNVWEWCATKWQKEYPYTIEDEWGNRYLEGTSARVLRGGSWDGNGGNNARCACRGRNSVDDRDINGGFRMVVSPIF